MRTLEEVVKGIASILEHLGIEYVITGGVAVSCWGNVRTTRDVDVILSIEAVDIESLVDALKTQRFSVKKEDIEEALKEKSHFTIFDEFSDYHVDAKGAYGKNELQTLKMKREIELDGVKCHIASPESLIVSKLLFGSEQDVKDAEGIYVRQLENLDIDHLVELCKDLNVYEEFLAMKARVERYL